MAWNINGSALAVGDVIQDFANTGDNHPYVVVEKGTWTVVLRNCTSHETSSLVLLKIDKTDKTGDPGWSGKDSYVVKSGATTNLHTYAVTTNIEFVNEPVATGPVRIVGEFVGTDGRVYPQYWQPTMIMSVPRSVQRYSDIVYRKVGTIAATRMSTLLTELSA